MICIKNSIINLIEKKLAYFQRSLCSIACGWCGNRPRLPARVGVSTNRGKFETDLNRFGYFPVIFKNSNLWIIKFKAQKIISPKFSALFLVLFFGIVSCNNSSTNSTPKKQEEVANKPVDSSSKTKTILFFGNSLTAGYGVEPAEAYPALIQDKIDSLHLKYKVVNAGVSGETTSGGNSRVDWILKQPMDIFVLELGANDGLRGIPLATTEQNLQFIIDKVRAAYPEVAIILEGMQIPPNMGVEYTTAFKDIYPRLAKENNIELVPFLLKDVAGDPKLNQQDGIHPTAEGHKILAKTVWEVLKKDL